MPISGVLVNVHDPDYVLATHKDGAHVKVEGQGFNSTDNQRWIAQFKYVKETETRLWSVQNKDTGNYLSWNSSMQVLMSDTEHWWKLVFVGENIKSPTRPRTMKATTLWSLKTMHRSPSRTRRASSSAGSCGLPWINKRALGGFG
ncbi:uncharacterized protein HD556DRAFT_1529073, partial [Suillus plorans]